jgi:SAM-dependent methyltransferase
MELREREILATADRFRVARDQIKSRDRVRDLAEVYTHEREVKAMLDLVEDMFPSFEEPNKLDRTFLEPACGHGNFLVEILHRKLRHVTTRCHGRGERFEHRVLRCLASIYGIDISRDNVEEAKERMSSLIEAHIDVELGGAEPTGGFASAVATILHTNVTIGNSLAGKAEIELVEYQPRAGGSFLRTWSRLDLAGHEPGVQPLVRRRDTAPLHYSELAKTPGPVGVKDADEKAA